jgi:hypothetical protein
VSICRICVDFGYILLVRFEKSELCFKRASMLVCDAADVPLFAVSVLTGNRDKVTDLGV